MKIYLVRHARAVPRADWKGEDLLRPLSQRGRMEADALAAHLAADPPRRVLCAPALRCQQTAEPIAVAADVPVDVDDRLAAGEEVERLLELLPKAEDGPLLLCTHVDAIEELLTVLELAGPERERFACKKGSVWVLEGTGYTPGRATYFEPVRRTKRGRVLGYSVRRVARPRTLRAAVLDMGSTSFTLLIADVNAEGEIRPVVGEKVMLRLGAMIATNAVIPDDVFRRAVRVARDLQRVAEQEKAQLFLPVATAAVREAKNGRELAAAISQGLREPIRILSGVEEARLMFRAFQHRLDLGAEPVVGFDLGGGSLELALGSSKGISVEATLPVGAVRLHGELVSRDPMGEAEARAIRERVRERLAPHRAALRRGRPVAGIATGGTVRALGRLVAERRGARKSRGPGSLEIPGDVLMELAKELAHSSHAERLRMRGVRRERADLLPTGALILATIAAELDLDGFTICDWGLRQGILLDALERGGAGD